MMAPQFSRFRRRARVAAVIASTLLFGASTGAQNPSGIILSDQWLALGPFSLAFEWGCGQSDLELLKEFIAPSSMALLVPQEGDEIEYDIGVAATTGYNGPPGLNGSPAWRLFNDGIEGDFFPDEDLDMRQDAANVGSASERVVTFVATYFEYLGSEPIDVEACAGSDDSVQVWIDKKLVVNDNDCRSRGQCQDTAPVTIAPGLHRIAMAVFNGNGDFGGSFGFKKDGEFITDFDPDWRFLGTDANGLVFPEAKFTVDVSSGNEPLTVQFDASASTTPSGSIAEYSWDFGDGEGGQGAKVSHTYQKGFFYSPRFTVTNSAQGSDWTEQIIDVRLPPQPTPPWSSADVGSPAIPGGERAEGECIGVFAGATTVGDTSDQFHFTYVPKAGTSYALTARIEEALWRPGAVAGIMLRETLDAGSRFAFAYAYNIGTSSGIQYAFLTRKAPGARALASRGELVQFPAKGYLRLERDGNEFRTYTSTDGHTWSPLYSTIFTTMSEDLLAGFAVAAGDSELARQSARITFCGIDFGPTGGMFHRGDADASGSINITDAIFVLNFLFLGGPAPACAEAANANDGSALNITSGIYLLNWLFLGGPEPSSPGPVGRPCGPDPDGSPSDLGCAAYTHC
jgi:PKD repeat protein